MRILIPLALLLAGTVALAAPAKRVVVTTTEIVLAEPIYFDVGKPVIKQESYALLDALAATLKTDKRLALVEIQSHTDARGDARWNLEISQKRADAIYDYLVGKGVDPKHLRAKGYGETRPLDKGKNPKAWAKNRRTSFAILQRITT